jgi:uncharacterized protein YyaL (SSP411 family)
MDEARSKPAGEGPPSRATATNRLAYEASPYLLQHAHNPVDWYPWGPEALARARREDKPILLSIGYAACHWCHVMERESFEDEETAALMNERFVSIKVDREERPDLDSIYMDAVQAMTGSGGWPMTVFLDPDGKPFFAGTYFPKEDRHGLPSFTRVLQGVAEAWQHRRGDVAEQGRRIVESITRVAAPQPSTEPPSEDVLRPAHAGLSQAFDRRWGGFGGAPKFPQPMTLEFLLRCHYRGYGGALEMVTVTLDRMAAGGIHDHVAGGFHRYSVDERWHVPHFEKMLYDNAQLARLYVHAWQVTGEEWYRRVATGTLDYLLREMRHPDGGFFSSQDADSEGEEGTFFVWSWEELTHLAEPVVARYLGATSGGNWGGGRNVLWTPASLEQVAEESGRGPEDLRAAVEAARARLFEARERRVRPATDDKILAAWNGLAISGLAEAGRAFPEQRYVEAAVGAADFVLSRMRRDDGRLVRVWREGRLGGRGYLDDYAAMADACLTLYETTFDVRWFEEARSLADDALRLFRDDEGGGFFQTGADAEALVIRPKELFDNAVPSGNSIAARVFQRLAYVTGEQKYEAAALSALGLIREYVARAPTMLGEALSALDLAVGPVREVALMGNSEERGTQALLAEVRRGFRPNVVLAAADPGDERAVREVPLLRDRPLVEGKPAAYVCEGFVCKRPVTEPADLAALLRGA